VDVEQIIEINNVQLVCRIVECAVHLCVIRAVRNKEGDGT